MSLALGLAWTEAGTMNDNDLILFLCAILLMALFSTLYWLLNQ